ncbi:HEAT repeat domain-containing protein [Sediminibacterium ginsengisoli]|nr:hypothetical protein [Sediminibacterium ginsengisoli]
MYPYETGCLLDSILTRFITRMTQGDTLLLSVLVLIVLIALVVASIYLYLFFKKKKFIYIERIRQYMEDIISQIIAEESAVGYEVPGRLYKILDNRLARQFAVDELVRCRKNFSGTIGEGIANLYIQLGLREFSLAKLKRSNKWHVKARGIQELYLMGQEDALADIYKYTDNRNEFVRMEAQTGVIHLTGFSGLRFLDIISYPLTEWQQLKLMEQLRRYPNKEGFADNLPKWLRSENNTVVSFALKLTEDYQQFGATEYVQKCLVHPDALVRKQAVRTLVQLADEKTPMVLCGYFSKEPLKNQVAILDALSDIITGEQSDFLKQQLEHPDHIVKLKAAALLTATSPDGLDFILAKAAEQPEPYQRIYNAVNSKK